MKLVTGYLVVVLALLLLGNFCNVNDWTELILVYTILPGVYFITVKEVGMSLLRTLPATRNDPRVVENNTRFYDLYQRIVRGTYATYIVIIGTMEVYKGSYSPNIWSYTSDRTKYHMYALALFYVYDTFILISSDNLGLNLKPDIPMYLHHSTLIACYIAASVPSSHFVCFEN